MVCEADKECQRHGFVSGQESRTNGLRSRQEVPKARIRERAGEANEWSAKQTRSAKGTDS